MRPLMRIGVLAKRGADSVGIHWGPTADYLSEQVPAYRFAVVPLGFDEILPAVDGHEIAFALVNSALYAELEAAHGALRVATLRNLRQGRPYEVFGGVIFRRADRPELATLADLRGRRFLAVDSSSLGGWLAAWRELAAAGIDPGQDFAELRFAGTHDAVVLGVLSGEADAGTVRTDTLERMDAEGLIELDDFASIGPRADGEHYRFPFLLSTRLYPEWPFAALAHTDRELTRQVAIALLRMPAESPAARAALAAGWTVPANYEAVRDLLRELQLPPFDRRDRVTLKGLLEDQWPLVSGLLLGLSLAIGLAVHLGRLNARLAHSRAALGRARDELEARVAERTAELAREVEERREAEARLREQERHLAYLASHDPLTRLPNRLLFHDRLEHAVRRALRDGTRCALLFFDLDRFKEVNDSLGHPTGDRLLQEVACRLAATVRAGDSVARLGGDELAVLLENIVDTDQAALVARKVQERVGEPLALDGFEHRVTLSMGIAVFPDDAEDPQGLLKCADIAMYRAKEAGRDRCEFYTQGMNVRAVERLALEKALAQAIEGGELALRWQPVIELETRTLRGAECLVRWQHPERGLLLPGDFIPLAEETGIAVPLGDWMLDAALARIRAWQDAGLDPVPVGLNLSARWFWRRDLVRRLGEALEAAGVAGDRLSLELTEEVAMRDPCAASETLTALRRLGVESAIDDFGTGASSLSCLKRLPLSAIKIDRSLIERVTSDPDDAAIVSAVVGLARRMGFASVALGVERPEQLDLLVREGCQAAQGRLLGPPMPARDFARLLAERQGATA